MASTISPEQRATVSKTRDVLQQGKSTISDLQRITSVEPAVKGPSWVSRQTFAAPREENHTITSLVSNAIADLGDGHEKLESLSIGDVDVRWTGYRPGVSDEEPKTDMPEEQIYDCMMKDVKHPVTILYFIGGGFYMNVPSRYHATTTKLARLTGGRCISFGYRLSPQHAFPAALLDALFTYLTLLYPSSGQFHSPVAASSIVFAGDSAGACLALSLIQVILSANSRGEKVKFGSQMRDVPQPAGVTLLSAGLDATYALATKENIPFDIFDGHWTYLRPNFPSCSIWPSNPPRGHIYCDTSLLCHPLVSPCIAKSWKGAPPMWFTGGQEVLTSATRLAVQILAQDGVTVLYEEYAEMPHDFPIMSNNWPWALTEEWPQTVKCLDHWAKACVTLGEGRSLKPGAVVVQTDGGTSSLSLETLSGLSWEQAKAAMERKVEGWEDWKGKSRE